MRLTDADALNKSIDTETYRHTYIEQIHEIIDNAPTIDAVEVVRCKDCKHWGEEYHGCNLREYGWDYKPDDFCSCGERREP